MYRKFLNRMHFSKCNSFEKIFCYVVSIIGAVVLTIILCKDLDTTSATFEDYNQLHEQIIKVEENPNIMLEQKGEIHIYDDKIIYKVENDECSMEGTFSRDFKLIETSQEDKAGSSFHVFLFGFCMIALLYLILFGCTYVIIFIVESLVILIVLFCKGKI